MAVSSNPTQFALQIAPLFDESKDFRAEKSLAMADFTSSLQIIEARLAKSLFLAGVWFINQPARLLCLVLFLNQHNIQEPG